MGRIKRILRRFHKRHINPNYWIAVWRFDGAYWHGGRGTFPVYAESHRDALKAAQDDVWSNAKIAGHVTVDVRRPNWLERILE